MTRNQYKKVIENQIKKINERIDYKIVNGIAYSNDSRRHKALLDKFRRQYETPSFFGKLLSFVHI